MGCTCHLMRGETCSTCMMEYSKAEMLDRINNCTSIVRLEKIVAGLAMCFMPNAHKDIIKMDWMGAAHEVMDEQPEYAALLVAAAEQWQAIEMGLDEETPDEESVVYDLRAANADKMKRHALSYGMGATKLAALSHKDPDGPPSGFFYHTEARIGNALNLEKAMREERRANSLRFINQPAKSLREELRMGVNYENWPE